MFKNRKYIIAYWDSFDLEFANFLELKNDIQIKEQAENFIYNRKYPIKETWSTYRVINHWMSKWLIDDYRDNENWWRKFNLKELLWISIISELRKFDLSISKIAKVKEFIYTSNEIFEFYIFKSYFKKHEIKLIVFENWEADLIRKVALEQAKILWVENHISISFTGIMESVLNKKIERKDISLMPINKTTEALLYKIDKEWDWKYDVIAENWNIKKYSPKNEKIENIENLKEVNLRQLIKENKNTKICIYTDDKWNITWIERHKKMTRFSS